MTIVEGPKRSIIIFIILALIVALTAGIFFDCIDGWSEREYDKECCHEFYKHGMIHACCDMGYHCSNESEYKSCYDRGYQDGLDGCEKNPLRGE